MYRIFLNLTIYGLKDDMVHSSINHNSYYMLILLKTYYWIIRYKICQILTHFLQLSYFFITDLFKTRKRNVNRELEMETPVDQECSAYWPRMTKNQLPSIVDCQSTYNLNSWLAINFWTWTSELFDKSSEWLWCGKFRILRFFFIVMTSSSTIESVEWPINP